MLGSWRIVGRTNSKKVEGRNEEVKIGDNKRVDRLGVIIFN